MKELIKKLKYLKAFKGTKHQQLIRHEELQRLILQHITTIALGMKHKGFSLKAIQTKAYEVQAEIYDTVGFHVDRFPMVDRYINNIVNRNIPEGRYWR